VQFNSLTLTLQNFIAAFSGGYSRLQGAANGLLAILVGIEVVLLGLWTALGGGEHVAGVFKKILHIGGWVWVVQAYPTLCKTFLESLVQAGLMAGGGGDASLLMDPSRLAGYGLDATEPLTRKLADLGMTDLADLFVFEFAYLAIMACFLIMAIHVFLAVLEYYLFAALVGIFLPFGLLAPTKFLAEKAVGAVVSASVKLMVLAFLLAVVDPVLAQIRFAGPEITFNELWSVFLTVCALMLLCWKAPSLAAALLGGSPHLGAGDVLQAATTPIAAAAAVGALAGRASSGGGGDRAGASGSSPAGGAFRGGGASVLAGPSGGAGGPRAGSESAPSGSAGENAGGPVAMQAGVSAAPGASASLVQSAMGKAASAPATSGSAASVSSSSMGGPSIHDAAARSATRGQEESPAEACPSASPPSTPADRQPLARTTPTGLGASAIGSPNPAARTT
jgi:type IV secretion system protein TrbL